jgi:type III secretion protein R
MNAAPDVGSLLVAALALAVLPFVAMVVTSYTKIVVVLGLLRNALGLQGVPPNSVLNGVALIVSCFVMAPVGMEAMHRAHRPA